MNTENSKTNEPRRFRLDSTNKLNLKNPNKIIALANLSIYYTWKNIKSGYNNNKFKISAPNLELYFWFTWLFLFYCRYSGLFWIYNKKTWQTLTENPPIQIYPNKIKNRIVFKIKTVYKLELLTPETMKLLESTKKDVDSDRHSENVPKLESVEYFTKYFNTDESS